MTPETARILARALLISGSVSTTLAEMSRIGQDGSPEAVKLAEVFVHEQRIINRIVHEHRDDFDPADMEKRLKDNPRWPAG